MSKHVNVALFVPHCGCPHTCSFCNQKTISGKSTPLLPSEVSRSAEIALKTGGMGGEIAFFGGSFTAIDREYMISLLNEAKPYIDKGLFFGIRCSTRPDAINEEILSLLKSYGVSSIELGAQSMNDRVLSLNERGHTAEDTVKASELIHSYGIELGLQMMTGLYGDSYEGAVETAKQFIKLRPSTVRIYPTIVIENTSLAELYYSGKYSPESVDSSAELCAALLKMFYNNNIKVIRLGLHSGGNVEDGFVAGPYHPAFREICESKIYLSEIKKNLQNKPCGNYKIYVSPNAVSKAIGQKKANIEQLNQRGYFCKIIPNNGIGEYEIKVENIL